MDAAPIKPREEAELPRRSRTCRAARNGGAAKGDPAPVEPHEGAAPPRWTPRPSTQRPGKRPGFEAKPQPATQRLEKRPRSPGEAAPADAGAREATERASATGAKRRGSQVSGLYILWVLGMRRGPRRR